MKVKKGFQQLVAEAESQITAISGEDLALQLSRPGVLLVDLRDVREVKREGKIADALHVPRGMLEFWIDPQSEYAKEVFQENRHFVFFCAAGFRSALATKLADDMGLSKVCHIEGGFSAWRDAGGEIIPLPEKKAR